MKNYQKQKAISSLVLTILVLVWGFVGYGVVYLLAYYTLIPGFLFILFLIRYVVNNEIKKYKKRNGVEFWE